MEAVILAGGLGTRLRSVVSEVPKCMAPVGGRPFLWYLLRQLERYGEGHVILSVGYLREVVKEWIRKEGSQFPFEYDFAEEETPLGTGGGIRLALEKAREPETVVLNGDTLFDVDLEGLVAHHRAHPEHLITLALKEMKDFSRYGTVERGGNDTITAFREKAYCTEGLINGGVYVLDSRRERLFEGLGERFSMENDVLQKRVGEGLIGGMVSNGYFLDIGIPEDYRRAETELAGVQMRLSDLPVEEYRTLLLDRDGILNRLRKNDYVKRWEEFEFLPGVFEALAKWSGEGKRILVVTNQRGIGKGLMSEEDLKEIHRRMVDEIERHGGHIDRIYHCASVSEADPARKPGTGMFEQACRDYPEIRRESCVMIGDSSSDMAFAQNCGIRGILLRTES